MAIDYSTIRNKNTGNAIYPRTSWKVLDDVPSLATVDDLNGANSVWRGVTPNTKIGWGGIWYRVQNNVLYIVGGGMLAEDPGNELFFSIPEIAGKIQPTILWTWNYSDCSWNRLIKLNEDGNVIFWNCAKNLIFSINAVIPLNDKK